MLSENRRAKFDYKISETLEAGIELLGTEVKSAKEGRMNLAGSHVLARNGNAELLGVDIPAYQPKNAPKEYDSKRTRRLLLHKSEIARLTGMLHEKGVTCVPLAAYLKRGLVKIELGIGRSKKAHDKRATLKERAHAREMRAEK